MYKTKSSGRRLSGRIRLILSVTLFINVVFSGVIFGCTEFTPRQHRGGRAAYEYYIPTRETLRSVSFGFSPGTTQGKCRSPRLRGKNRLSTLITFSQTPLLWPAQWPGRGR